MAMNVGSSSAAVDSFSRWQSADNDIDRLVDEMQREDECTIQMIYLKTPENFSLFSNELFKKGNNVLVIIKENMDLQDAEEDGSSRLMCRKMVIKKERNQAVCVFVRLFENESNMVRECFEEAGIVDPSVNFPA